MIALGVLGAIWGSSFLFMRIAAAPLGPLALVEIRLALGAAVLMPFLWRERRRFPLRRWPFLALTGTINAAIPFLLFAWGAERAPAGIGAICNALTVPFTVLIGAVVLREHIGWRRMLALVMGFAGIVVLVSGKTSGSDLARAVAAGCTAAFLYGIGVHMVRRRLGDLPPMALAAATLGCAALLVLPFALWQWPGRVDDMRVWGAATTLGILCTGIAYAVYYQLIQRIGSGPAATVTYLVPAFGVAWAWLVLGEPVTPTMVVACALILVSVAVLQRAGAARKR